MQDPSEPNQDNQSQMEVIMSQCHTQGQIQDILEPSQGQHSQSPSVGENGALNNNG